MTRSKIYEIIKSTEIEDLPYDEYLNTEHWQEVRKRALAIAENRCQIGDGWKGAHQCKGPLAVHHRDYERKGKEWNDVIVLCEYHHALIHEKQTPKKISSVYIAEDYSIVPALRSHIGHFRCVSFRSVSEGVLILGFHESLLDTLRDALQQYKERNE